jgi:exodeoxyribonuclease VII small subunit
VTEELGYEAARAELADVVRRLESGGPTLEESLRLWERGEQLADLCQRWLQGATARLDDALAQREAAGAGLAGADSDASDSGNPADPGNSSVGE